MASFSKKGDKSPKSLRDLKRAKPAKPSQITIEPKEFKKVENRGRPSSSSNKPQGNLDRIPKEHLGVQLNGCRNVSCESFGSFKTHQVKDKGLPKTSIATEGLTYHCECKTSGLCINNEAANEVAEITSTKTFFEKETSCKNAWCDNFHKSIYDYPERYVFRGMYTQKVSGLSKPQWACRLCNSKRLFQTSHNQTNHKASKASARIDNRKIFLELLEGLQIRTIARQHGISEKTVYDKLNFFCEQSMRWLQRYERVLKQKDLNNPRIETDAQVLTTNWRIRDGEAWWEGEGIGQGKKAGTSLTRLTSSIGKSSYVLEITFDFDITIKTKHAYQLIANNSNYHLSLEEREFSWWDNPDFANKPQIIEEVNVKGGKKKESWGVVLNARAQHTGHFLKIKDILQSTPEAVFVGDTSPSYQLATLAVFKEEVKDNRFVLMEMSQGTHLKDLDEKKIEDHEVGRELQVSFKNQCHDIEYYSEVFEFYTGLATRDDKTDQLERTTWYLNNIDKFVKRMPPEFKNDRCYPQEARLKQWLTEKELARSAEMIEQEIRQHSENGWGDNYVKLPNPRVKGGLTKVRVFSSGSLYATDYNRIARAASEATTHSVDNFFQFSRKATWMKRKEKTARSSGKRLQAMMDKALNVDDIEMHIFDASKAYDPRTIVKLSDMQRFYYNFVRETKRDYETEAKTPAMRQGLIDRPISFYEFMNESFYDIKGEKTRKLSKASKKKKVKAKQKSKAYKQQKRIDENPTMFIEGKVAVNQLFAKAKRNKRS